MISSGSTASILHQKPTGRMIERGKGFPGTFSPRPMVPPFDQVIQMDDRVWEIFSQASLQPHYPYLEKIILVGLPKHYFSGQPKL